MTNKEILIGSVDKVPDKEFEAHSDVLRFGIAISNLANPYNSHDLFPSGLVNLQDKVISFGQGIEVQPEEGILPASHDIKNNLAFVGMHLPIRGVDLLGDKDVQEYSYQVINDAFTSARDINADYVVTHLHSSKLTWQNLGERSSRVDVLKTHVRKILEAGKENGYSGKILFENLEYPLYPATRNEIIDFKEFLTEVSKDFDSKTGICIDVGHLWHTRILIRENAWREENNNTKDAFSSGTTSFAIHLRGLLNNLGESVNSFHIAGGDINPQGHFTHHQPEISVSDGEDVDEVKLDIPGSLQVIYEYLASNLRKATIVNEAHQESYANMIHSNESLKGFLEFCYPKNEITNRDIENFRDFYLDPRVKKAIIEFLGGTGEEWESAEIMHEYLGIGYEDKLQSGKKSPVSTIEPKTFANWVDRFNGELEIHASLLSAPRPEVDLPSRALFIIDLDRYLMVPNSSDGHMKYDEKPMYTPHDTYSALEPVMELYLDFFDRLGMPVMTTLTGKGIHFISQVHDTKLMQQLIEIGGPVEDTLEGKLENSQRFTKSKRPIPLEYQQLHVGVGRLQQLVNTMLIMEARKRLNPYFEAELFAKAKPGHETNGFAFDNAAIAFPVYHKNISVPGSPNLIKALKTGLKPLPVSIQIPISGNGFRFNWREVAHNRTDLSAAAAYLESVDCHIPVTANLEQLIALYASSPLKSLHLAMDATMGDKSEDFAKGYRKDNYEGIIKNTKDPSYIRNIIDFAPEYFGDFPNFHALDVLIFQVFEAMGGNRNSLDVAPHVAGFLRALFEDPYKNWSDRWTGRMDALCYSRKMTEQILGQMFERDYF